MTYSLQQLIALALDEFGIPGAGQTASAEDVAKVNERVNSVMDDLARRDVWHWGDPDQIEDAAALHLAVILANATAGAFDRPSDDQKRNMAESRLRLLDRPILTGQPVRSEYF